MYFWEIVQKMTEEIETYGSCDMRAAREMWQAETPTQYMHLIKRERARIFLDGEEIFDFQLTWNDLKAKDWYILPLPLAQIARNAFFMNDGYLPPWPEVPNKEKWESVVKAVVAAAKEREAAEIDASFRKVLRRGV